MSVRKVIASMTVGKDVSALFPDVVNCMQTDNLELKKLVYLYLMNYAKSQPDMAIMAVNTFVKDCEDPNPLIRALAVRTMGCIRVDKITEYLCEPLRKCLKDEDPYVRKTAAVCVAKLYDINALLVEDQGFLDQLKDLLSDSNPMASSSGSPLVEMSSTTVNKLLTALNECTEWGQVFILDSLANYSPKDEREAQSTCERITPRLAHANAAVVLSAVKVLMKFMEMLHSDSDFVTSLTKKLAPPLVTLLSSEPEVQYVALRNINLIVQKRPDILKHEMKVDVDFVRKAVRAIGRCAIKVEQSAERCVSTLLDLIQTKVNYVVQEAIVVIKDIFRKYPNKYESIISTLCENLDTLDEPEASSYAERIDNADELLESFLEGFADENSQVQLQLLTAIVKLFLKRPSDTQELVQQVLSLATQDSDNPDLRDRGFIYWRLLSTDPAAAKEVVLAEKPLISEETDLLEPTLLDELICHISSLASVYHKPPSAFVEGRAGVRKSLPARAGSMEGGLEGPADTTQVPSVIPAQDSLIGDLLSMDIGAPTPIASTTVPTAQAQPAFGAPSALDLLGGGLDTLLGDTSSAATTAPSLGNTGLLGDIFGLAGAGAAYVAPKVNWLPADKGKGLEIWGTFSRRGGQVQMDVTLTNKAMQPMVGFAIQLNKNSFGLTPAAPLQVQSPLPAGQTCETSMAMATTGPVQRMEPLTTLQQNNVFTIAKRNVEGQDMLYQSLKLTNGIWVLNELKIQPGNPNITLSLKTRTMNVAESVFAAYDAILHS
ncbi:hypothetical protein B566_EDAN017468 [Ephemera danica]|nr:hypothetical protein B566_EDAN017468 [Ephemera danica]